MPNGFLLVIDAIKKNNLVDQPCKAQQLTCNLDCPRLKTAYLS